MNRDQLFTPLNLGPCRLANRIFMPAHRTNFSRHGLLSQGHSDYLLRRVQGGCGLIIMGELAVHDHDRPHPFLIDPTRPENRQSLTALTGKARAAGSVILAQLRHHGFQSSGTINRQPLLAPSAAADIVFNETAKTMEKEDLAKVKNGFAQQAALLREAGFDGLEIDMGPESLLRQFLSPLTNRRQDKYGGDLDSRLQFPLEVLTAIRQTVGQDWCVGILLSADERFPGGIDAGSGVTMAEKLTNSGQLNFIHPQAGCHYNPHLRMASMHVESGPSLALTAAIKAKVGTSVLASQKIDLPDMALQAVAQGEADAIGLIRPLIADPDLPEKLRRDRSAEIRPCVRENQGCLGRISQDLPLSCIQNPLVGKDTQVSQPGERTRPTQKRVLVAGAGPAGLEAALSLAGQGHEVMIYEQAQEAGGQVRLAMQSAGRQPLGMLIDCRLQALGNQGIHVRTGITVTPDLIREVQPDLVVIATGAIPKRSPLPGRYGPPQVVDIMDVFDVQLPEPTTILVLDENGGHRTTATVELLADQGHKLTILTAAPYVGQDLAPLGDLYLSRQRLLHKGVVFITDQRAETIDGLKVLARDLHSGQEYIHQEHQLLLLALAPKANNRLYEQLKGLGPELCRIGDCLAPRGLEMALLEGRLAGEER